MTSPIFVFATLFIGILLLLCTVFYFKFGRELLKARASGAPVKFIELIALKLRKIPSDVIIDARIKAANNGINISIDDLATHFLAGGNVNIVVDGLVSAKEKNLNLTFDQIAKFDFEDKNIPTVFNCRECGVEVTTTKICKNCHAKFPAIDSKSYKKLRKAKVMFVAGLTIIVITIVIKLLEK
ncbi:flotillin-like FloA family protein [Verrucomicrobia bacterium]|nr:flotillin-like FloA family protein [Verrucomicrobiota bacterium]